MSKRELAIKVAEHMKKVRSDIEIERTAAMLQRKMTTRELEICIRHHNKMK